MKSKKCTAGEMRKCLTEAIANLDANIDKVKKAIALKSIRGNGWLSLDAAFVPLDKLADGCRCEVEPELLNAFMSRWCDLLNAMGDDEEISGMRFALYALCGDATEGEVSANVLGGEYGYFRVRMLGAWGAFFAKVHGGETIRGMVKKLHTIDAREAQIHEAHRQYVALGDEVKKMYFSKILSGVLELKEISVEGVRVKIPDSKLWNTQAAFRAAVQRALERDGKWRGKPSSVTA